MALKRTQFGPHYISEPKGTKFFVIQKESMHPSIYPPVGLYRGWSKSFGPTGLRDAAVGK